MNVSSCVTANCLVLLNGKFAISIVLVMFDLFLKKFIYLFMAVLGLHCCAWAFSSCGEQGLLFVVRCGARASHCSGFSCCRPPAQHVGFSSCGTHVGSSRTRARTRVPCIGRWILNHCTTREVPIFDF